MPTHACIPGCTIRCSNVVGSSAGNDSLSPLKYETIGLLGSNLDMDQIAALNWEANDLGADSSELGAALGVAAPVGIFQFGDYQCALQLMAEITGKVFGVERVPAVKGQAMSAYDPRAIKGTGVTYATSPQGADHTAGLTIRTKVDHINPQVQVSQAAHINMAGYDTLGARLFAGFRFSVAPAAICSLLHALLWLGRRDGYFAW